MSFKVRTIRRKKGKEAPSTAEITPQFYAFMLKCIAVVEAKGLDSEVNR